MEYCELHTSLRTTMRVSRWAGMFPIEGLNNIDIGKLRFNMKSIYTWYYISTIVLQTLIMVFSAHWFFINDINLGNLASLVFYLAGLTSAILLLKLARDWPGLVRRAASLERRVTCIRETKTGTVTFNMITYVVLVSGAVEHALSLAYKVKNSVFCQESFDVTKNNFLEDFFCYTFPFIFKYVPSNCLTNTMCMIASLQATFLWNFTDVITICFSMYLTSYFNDFNILVNSQKTKKTRDWEQIRIYYSKLVALVQAVDSKICYLILLSILSNLFFICLQLFNTLKFGFILIANCTSMLQEEQRNIDKLINLFYYTYSFLFLVTRATIMLFLAANVNSAALAPKHALSCVPSRDYNLNVQRFNRQLRYTTTALSGGFFYVTRGMILKVFATIVTYELVLLQFSKL